MKQVSQYVNLQSWCILHHTYILQGREEYSFSMGKDSILVQEAGLELENLAQDLTEGARRSLDQWGVQVKPLTWAGLCATGAHKAVEPEVTRAGVTSYCSWSSLYA